MIVEFVDEVCGIYFRSVLLPKAGDRATQHEHDHDHATYIGSGGVRLYVNGGFQGAYAAGTAVEVKAGHMHAFEATEDETRLTCVHIAASAESAKAVPLLQEVA